MSRDRKERSACAQPESTLTPDDSTAPEQSAEPGRGMSGAAKRNMIMLLIVGVLVVGGGFAALQSIKPRTVGDTIVKTYSQGQPCATTKIAIAPSPGADPSRVAETLFEALKAAPGMNSATYDIKTSTLEAGYCESNGTEDGIRAALAPTGLVAAAK